jgi:large subunit ribosomal protein L10
MVRQEKVRQDKIDRVEEVKTIFESGRGLIFADHSGIKAEDSVKIRNRLADIDAYIKIIKNTLALIAAGKVLEEMDLSGVFKGPTSIIVSGENMVPTAKLVKNFTREFESFKVKAGIFENKLFSAADIDRLSILPSKEVLISMLAGMLQLPMSRLVNTLSGVTRNLVVVLEAVRQKKEIIN